MKTIAKIELKADGSGKKRLLDTMEVFNADVNAAKNIRTRAVSTSLLSSATDLLKVG